MPDTAPSLSSVMRFGRFLGLVVVYFGIFAYPPLRVGAILWPDWSPGTGALLLLLTGPSLGWLIHQRWRNPLTRGVLRLTYTWAGVVFLSFSIIVVWDILCLVPIGKEMLTDSLLITCLTAVLMYALLSAHRLTVRRIRVSAPGLSQPLRVVQLSDVHVGSRTTAFLRRVVYRVNQLEADLVLITGDLVDLRGLPDSVYAPLQALEARTYFVTGNHERYISADDVCSRLEAHDVQVLRNAVAIEKEVQLIGVEDAEGRDQVARVLEDLQLEDGKFSILMYHRPDGLEAAAKKDVHLMLCGHTHNGQIMPFNYLVRRVFPRICGRYGHDGTVLYVSPGTGTWGPLMRLGSTNEITEFELLPASSG